CCAFGIYGFAFALCSFLCLFVMLRPLPSVSLFPYTTLFRSAVLGLADAAHEQVGVETGLAHHGEYAAVGGVERDDGAAEFAERQDRKSTRLNSSHVKISYAVFCLKKKNMNCFLLR